VNERRWIEIILGAGFIEGEPGNFQKEPKTSNKNIIEDELFEIRIILDRYISHTTSVETLKSTI
jgi:hypothetical protein